MIEKYEDVEKNALIAYNATNATGAITVTMGGHEEEVESQK